MQSKSSRGVQQEDVWGAADALIGEGLRPTIERVRQKMGRGSPNTVSPMLEAWFATLGPRLALGAAKAEEGGPPAAVRQAMAKMWEIALSSAQLQATEGFEQARQGLENDRSALAKRESELGHQTELLNERLAASEIIHMEAKSQLANLNARFEEAHAVLNQRNEEIERLQAKLTAVERQLTDDRRLRDQEAARHAEERERLEARDIASERRLMEELDRERQESKKAKSAMDRAELRAEALRVQLENENNTLSGKVQEKENELKLIRQSLMVADARAVELRGLLDAQRASTGDALDQLNRLLTEATVMKTSAASKNKRKSAGPKKL
jgi:chromosome segregation ATPase